MDEQHTIAGGNSKQIALTDADLIAGITIDFDELAESGQIEY